jgi:NAD(P)-dependent dehydrogenase (short-subunit alcohol dehydrogenase family)
MTSDRNIKLAKQFADEHNSGAQVASLHYVECDTSLWESQHSAFKFALKVLDERIDFVAPIAGIGEKKWLPAFEETGKRGIDDNFVKPDLSVIDIDLTGVLYTIALAVQQFRCQKPLSWSNTSQNEYRGKIGLVVSVCAFYCVPSLPIYTAAKYALIGLTRSYGNLLPGEGMTLSAVVPSVMRTSISSDVFYNQMEERGLLTPMEGVLGAFKEMIVSDGSGKVYECGPEGGWKEKRGAEYIDARSEQCLELLLQRATALNYD